MLLSDGTSLEVAASAGEHPGTLEGRRLSDTETWLNDLQAETPSCGGSPPWSPISNSATARGAV